ncbi:MAG: phospholipase C [Haliangiales bacterium]
MNSKPSCSLSHVRHWLLASAVLCAALCVPATAWSWNAATHERIAGDALRFLGSAHADDDMGRAYELYVSSAGTEPDARALLGAAARDFDNRADLEYCGWWVFGCHSNSDWFLDIVNSAYTKLTHAINIAFVDSDFGNDHPGYDYRKVFYEGQLGEDALLKDWLYNQNISDWTIDVTFANYTFDGQSYSHSDCDDYQDCEHPPLDNAVRYWFDSAMSYATFTRIGYMCHGADAGVPQHARGTWGRNHGDFEQYCGDRYDGLALDDFDQVSAYIDAYSTAMRADEIITTLADFSYFEHAATMTASDGDYWDAACRDVVAHAIAACAVLFTKASNCLHGEDCNN